MSLEKLVGSSYKFYRMYLWSNNSFNFGSYPVPESGSGLRIKTGSAVEKVFAPECFFVIINTLKVMSATATLHA